MKHSVKDVFTKECKDMVVMEDPSGKAASCNFS